MIVIKWLVLAIIDWLLLLTLPVAAPAIALFTREMPYGYAAYTWGWWWGTYDNPPQGDEGYVRKRAPFIGYTTGWRGYINRAWWMIRNPLYGFARRTALNYSSDQVQHVIGQDGISDKDKIPGWYFVRLHSMKSGKCVGFEFYGVFPYSKTCDLRIRLGWKILTDKFRDRGFAPIVNTFNPFDGYGDD